MVGEARDAKLGAGVELALVMGEVVEKRLLKASLLGCRGCGAANCVLAAADGVVAVRGGRDV